MAIMRLLSGDWFNLETFEGIEHFKNLTNIVKPLHRIPRFTGHLRHEWSVGQHSVLCYMIAQAEGANEETLKAVFAHDFHEVVTNDLSRPFVSAMPQEMQNWIKEYKRKLDCAIGEVLNIDFYNTEIKKFVRKADDMALNIEKIFCNDWKDSDEQNWSTYTGAERFEVFVRNEYTDALNFLLGNRNTGLTFSAREFQRIWYSHCL